MNAVARHIGKEMYWMPSRRTPESPSWYVLSSGELLPLTTTQALLVDLAPMVEDMNAAYLDLKLAVAESVQMRNEARELIVGSRRQRLDLRLYKGASDS